MRRASQRLEDVRDGFALEQLEPRLVLAGSPLPTLAMLEDPGNTVVRVETNYGDIDLELFDSVAPITVTNFVDYIRGGDYDSTIFHRLVSGFVVQGGGWRFTTADTDNDGLLEGATRVPSNGAILNEFGRSNVERTIAMAKLGGDPNSATSEWFINLSDNSSNLDNQNGGFTVFGRVLGDDSWSVVQTIGGLSRINAVGFQDLPVSDDFAGSFTEDTLVSLNDLEIIKDGDADDFYDTTIYYPEGFSGSTINEFLPIGNPNDDVAYYQVIARSEISQPDPDDGMTDFWFRDRVIATGSIPANSRGGITISRFTPGTGAPNPDDLVPQGIPYALELRSTIPVSANLSHFDFGSATGESFVGTPDTTYAFANASKGGNAFEFIVWQNVNPEPVTLDITFYVDGQSPITESFTTERYRRGGLAFNDFPTLPNDSSFGIEVVASDPILVALTQFATGGSSPLGSSTLGQAGEPAARGVIPIGVAGSGGDQRISVLNPGNTVAVVGLVLEFNDGRSPRQLPASLIVQPGQRGTFDLGTVSGLNDPDDFTLLYNAGSARVYAQSLQTDLFTVNGDPIADNVAQPVATRAATQFLFAEGFIDPARAGIDVFETVAIYNPNTTFFGPPNQSVTVDVIVSYTDGFELTLSRTVEAGKTEEFKMHELSQILDQGNNNGRFFYSLQVIASAPVVAQMIHFDLTLGALQPSGGFSTLGTPVDGIIDLADLGIVS